MKSPLLAKLKVCYLFCGMYCPKVHISNLDNKAVRLCNGPLARHNSFLSFLKEVSTWNNGKHICSQTVFGINWEEQYNHRMSEIFNKIPGSAFLHRPMVSQKGLQNFKILSSFIKLLESESWVTTHISRHLLGTLLFIQHFCSGESGSKIEASKTLEINYIVMLI